MTLEEALTKRVSATAKYKVALHEKVRLDGRVQELRKIASNAHNDWAELEMARRAEAV